MDLTAHEYPPDWPKIARACKERAGWKCEECGVADGDIGSNGLVVVLEAAHMGENRHLKSDCSNLKALCRPCHKKADAPYIAKARAYHQQRWDYLWAQEFGCGDLWEEWRATHPEGKLDRNAGIWHPVVSGFIQWVRHQRNISHWLCAECGDLQRSPKQCHRCNKTFCRYHLAYSKDNIHLCEECQDAVIAAWLQSARRVA